ncbi:MAG: sulfite oxidase [Gemmatimonadota bacterium]|nr:sulfite oxidase [Gemmatimonadota bacterium]
MAESSERLLTRRSFVAVSTVAATTLLGSDCAAAGTHVAAQTGVPMGEVPCTTVPDVPTAERPDPQENWRVFSAPETVLAFRNHGMQSELLREPITPLGAHFLLIHFDIPRLSAENYSVAIGGRVRTRLVLPLSQLKSRPPITQAVTMECAGTGRSTMRPRAVYVPWFKEAIGTYQWTGTPLRPLLEQAGLLDDAVEVLFTGWDTGVDLGVEHAFERSLPIAEALRDEVMLAWGANGQALLPQHGFPLRLIVPSWYGMASVKWLRAITVLNKPFKGIQQAKVYRYQQRKGEPGEPVQKKRVHSVMMPPGIPDLISRHRFLAPGRQSLQGTAWSGSGRITRVEVSTDGGSRWTDAKLVPISPDRFAWIQWRSDWQVDRPGEYVLACRATDEAGNVQPLDPNARWSRQGMGGNGVQRIPVTVRPGIGAAGTQVPSVTQSVVPGAEVPPPS